MNSSKPTVTLRENIAKLQVERSTKEELLQEELHEVYESLKPSNLIREAMRDITSSNAAVDGLLIPLIGMGVGHLVKRVVVGNSENASRQAIGEAVETSVVNVIVQHPEEIRAVGVFLVRFILGGKRKKPLDAS